MRGLRDKRPILWLLIAMSLWGGCELQDPQEGLTTSDVITLSVSDTSLLADGVSLTVLTATLGPEASANQSITFDAGLGTFEQVGTPATSITRLATGRSAEAVLITGTQVSDRVLISASITGISGNQSVTYTAEKRVTFARAYPDEIQLRLDNGRISASVGSSTTLTATLLRRSGFVSRDTEVAFEVQPAAGDSVQVSIPEVAVADTDEASVSVSVLDTLAGQVILRAWVLDDQGDTSAVQQVVLDVD